MIDNWNGSPLVNPHDYKYCPKCGKELNIKTIDNVSRLACDFCKFIFYQNPVPAVAAVLIKDKKVLLVKRKYEPKANDWCLPAGFLEFGESLKSGLIREIKEETNLDIHVESLFQVYNAMDDPRYHVVLLVYHCKIINGNLKPGDDAVEAIFFPFDALPGNIAFSSHRQTLATIKNQISDK